MAKTNNLSRTGFLKYALVASTYNFLIKKSDKF